MANHSRKRAYSESSTSSDETPEEEPEKLISDEDITERLNLLDSATRRKLLIHAAQSHLDVLQAVKAETNPLYEHARSSTLYFDRFAIAVYKLTHCPDKYDGGRLPEAFEADQVDLVVSKILRYIKTIDKDSPQYASFATRQNALVTLGQMCRYVFDANSPVGKEVIAHFKKDGSLVKVMQKIVGGLTKEEINLMKSRALGKKWLLETDKLAQETRSLHLFPSLGWVVARVGGWHYSWQDEVQKKERARQRKRFRSSY